MIEAIREIIAGGSRFMVATHIDPDGDAVGSAFALYWALASQGKSVNVFLSDEVPYQYRFLPQPPTIFHDPPSGPFDGVFVVDCSSLERVARNGNPLKGLGPVVNIDHHVTGEDFGAANLRDPKASSTGELLYRVLKDLGIPMDYNVAINIYTAVLTDTGSFRFQNTNAEAFVICREMVRLGVNPSYVSGMVYENHPLERYQLLGMVLSTLRSFRDGRVVVAQVTRDMYRRTGTNREHSDGFVELIKQVRGADVAILVRQLDNGRYKISMRSKGTVDVARVCGIFGGGGHRNAAGCVIDGTEEQVTRRLKEALEIT